MSKEHAKNFVEKLQTDEDLRKQVHEASEHIIQVAKKHGYEVTRDDLRSVLKERWSGQREDEDDPATRGFSEAPGF